MVDSLIVQDAGDGITVITLNRPERLNALNRDIVGKLHDAISTLNHQHDCRAVILTGAGAGFCAGLDLQDGELSLPDTDHLSGVNRLMLMQEHIISLMEALHRCRKPIIAAVNGPAVGGGFGIAVAADIRIVSESARFGVVFMKLGASNCDMGISYLLPRLIGGSRAAELFLTGRIIDADEAYRIGLVHDVVPDEDLFDRAMVTAREVAAHGAFQLWMTKETMWGSIDAPSMRYAIDLENRTQIMCTQTGEFEANVAAYQARSRNGA
ncbi:Enoyl-CoA hydratase/isomerase [Mycolicibacterium rhodesiae JS60]|nr:Enoyl-CoA hydratase/isomerase [Mycolicibacterium rhodesiae JS60]